MSDTLTQQVIWIDRVADYVHNTNFEGSKLQKFLDAGVKYS